MRVALALLLVTSSLAASGWERPVIPAGPGPNLLPIDALLVVESQPGFAGLRIVDSAGREVPYLLVPPEDGQRRWTPGAVRSIPRTKEQSGIELELPRAIDADAIRIAGIAAPFLKKVTIEGSGDRRRWTVLSSETTIFDLPEQQLRRDTVEFSRTPLRFVRIIFDDRSSARAFPSGPIEVREAGVASAPAPMVALELSPPERRAEKTLIRIRLPERGFPLTAIVPRVENGTVFREAKVTELRMAGRGLEPVTLGTATLRRAELGGEVASDLRIPISRPETAEIELTIEDGSNPPLAFASIEGEIAPQPAIFFESADGEELTASWGDPAMKAPRYDIEALRPRLADLHPARASWGAPHGAVPARTERALAGLSVPVGAKVDAGSFRWSRVIRGGSGLVAVPIDAAALAHGRPGVDFRIVDGKDRQVPYLLETRDERVRLELPLPRRVESERPAISRYEVRLPHAGLPSASLVLRTSAPYFRRDVRLLRPPVEPRGSETEVAHFLWAHAGDAEAPPLTIPLPPRAGETYIIEIDEEENAPIPLTGAELLLPSYRVRYVNPNGEDLRLLYGNAMASAPRYDLELLASRLLAAPATEASLDPEREAEGGRGTAEIALFWVVVAAAAIALLALTARMLR